MTEEHYSTMAETGKENMELFDSIIPEVRNCFSRSDKHKRREYTLTGKISWPVIQRGNVVLASDTAIELGGPETASVSYMLWTGRSELVHDKKFTLTGPDLKSPGETALPLGKIVLLGVDGMTSENCAARYTELEMVRHSLNLKGYMMRAASQYMREWSRVSREAIADGFSLKVLADRLYSAYMELDYVTSAEILIVTASEEKVLQLSAPGEKAARRLAALTKMTGELSADCGQCDYNDVCSEVAVLRKMRSEK
jgi:CO dehydrogenase/acetyl-CoA synthase beta subunit